MQGYTSRCISIFVTLVASVLLSACTVRVTGTATAPYLHRYTGPKMVSSTPLSADSLFPGIQVGVGSGSTAVTCTAGWITRDQSKRLHMLLAGHCARTGAGAVVSMNLNGSVISIGKVASTSYREPYSHDDPDFAIVDLDSQDEVNIPIKPFANLGIPLKGITERELNGFIFQAKSDSGMEVCWVYNAAHTIQGQHVPGAYDVGCGTVVDGGDSRFSVRVVEGGYTPQVAGAPVMIGSVGLYGDVFAQPVGVVVESHGGLVIIDTLPEILPSGSSCVITTC